MSITNNAAQGEFLEAVAALGATEGQGSMARPNLALAFAQAVSDGNATGITAEHAESVWDTYSLAARRVGGDSSGSASSKAQVSKLKAFGKAASLKGVDFPYVLGEALRMKQGGKGKKGESAYDALLNVARAQLRQPDEELSIDDIEDALSPEGKAREDKDAATRYAALLKEMTKLRDGVQSDDGMSDRAAYPSEALSIAIEAVEHHVASLGGAPVAKRRGNLRLVA